jgi:uncharacterized protein
VRGIERLRLHGIEAYVICVLHRESLAQPDEMFAFFQALGVPEVCFNVEEIEGVNLHSSMDYTDVARDTEAFFRRYFELLDQATQPHWLREHEHTLRRLFARKTRNPLVTPFGILTVGSRGDYATYSPELLGTMLPD